MTGREGEASLKQSIIKKIVVLAVAVALIFLDQATKILVVERLKDSGQIFQPVLPGLLELQYLENPAAAFGLFGNIIWLIAVLTVVVAIGIVVLLFRYKQHDFFSYTAAALLLAGGLGNLIDRMSRGYVVDFIHIMFFDYVFNVADCCVTVGVVCLLIHYILYLSKENKASSQLKE